MKKTYTKKQIHEAIVYWKKQLKTVNESQASDAYELACIPQIKKYIVDVLGYDESSVFADDGTSRISPLPNKTKLNDLRKLNSLAGEDVSLVSFQDSIAKCVPEFEKYTWFIFHTGYENSNADILVAKQEISPQGLKQKLDKVWSIQNIEIKRYASSYLFQPQFECSRTVGNGALKINSLSHAYINQFSTSAKILNNVIMTAIWNDPQYQRITNSIRNARTLDAWFNAFMKGAESKNLMTNVEIPNVEELVKTFYFDGYDLNRRVTVFQIGNGKNARLFKVSNVRSNSKTDPLDLMRRCNTFSSAFNTILLNVQVRKINGKYKVYGKIHFSNKDANKIGSFDPDSILPN